MASSNDESPLSDVLKHYFETVVLPAHGDKAEPEKLELMARDCRINEEKARCFINRLPNYSLQYTSCDLAVVMTLTDWYDDDIGPGTAFCFLKKANNVNLAVEQATRS